MSTAWGAYPGFRMATGGLPVETTKSAPVQWGPLFVRCVISIAAWATTLVPATNDERPEAALCWVRGKRPRRFRSSDATDAIGSSPCEVFDSGGYGHRAGGVQGAVRQT